MPARGLSRTFLACLAHTNLLAHLQHPTNHVIVTSDLDDRHGVYDRGVTTATIINVHVIVDADEDDVATAIRDGGVGDVKVAVLMNGADDGVIVVKGETMVTTKRYL